MTEFTVKKTGHIGSTKVEEGQTVVRNGKLSDIKFGEKYLLVSVFFEEEKIEIAKKDGILEEI